jgi:hypothetical protein
MDDEKLLDEYGMEFAIQNIAQKIAQKMDEYKDKKDEESQKELAMLLQDRQKIYLEDKETIKKYLKKYNGGI